ncbi:alkaline phosphatase [Marinivivus vitaminiproducens]|uniref:alkaline phosphatase n=1 Tax=Marinivivus vitaminiproducens TaxID=3035935 RepID=UPI002798ECC1|nr:alkaline phosphatase [Geminicoccaceae bacterium SCSIO 64248]
MANEESMAGTNGSGETAAADGVAKNVIFMLPDGFSTAQADAYRYFKAGSEAPVWEDHLTGMVKTSSSDNLVTDSAASATAYATGEKTYNGAIAVDPDGRALDSVLDIASDAGKATGIVSTAAITDASPAAFGASTVDRGNQDDIAAQYTSNGDLDVILGGGRAQFLPEDDGGAREDGIDLVDQAGRQGFDTVTTADELEAATGDRLLGLFTDADMSAPIGNGAPGERPDGEPTLAEMTEATLDRLSQDGDGFFAVIEEEGTDTWGHANDAATVMNSAQSFDDAWSLALDFAERNPGTLIVSVADHETGGMTTLFSDEANPEVFQTYRATYEDMLTEAFRRVDVDGHTPGDAGSFAVVRDTIGGYTGGAVTLDDETIASIFEAPDEETAYATLAEVLNAAGGVNYSTTGHSAVDVPIYAYGTGAEHFEGLLDNTDVGIQLAAAMGLDLPEGQGDTMTTGSDDMLLA